MTDTNSVELHDHLLDADEDGLHNNAEYYPRLREWLADLPKTRATFSVTDIDALETNGQQAALRDIDFEFLKSWRVPEWFETSHRRRYVNPHYRHRTRYTDAVKECQCGARQVYSLYNQEESVVRAENEHTDDCKPWMRLRVRADLNKVRYERLMRLSKLGWTGADIAPRLGLERSSTSSAVTEYGHTMRELRKEYKRVAGNTYGYLVHNCGVDGGIVGDVYGHQQTTLTKWKRKFSDVYVGSNVHEIDLDNG